MREDLGVTCPFVWLGEDKSTNQFASTVFMKEIFRVFDVLHVRNDRFGVETVFVCTFGIFDWKLLTFDSSGLILSELNELHQISRTGIVCLSLCGMMSHLGADTFLFSDL